MAGRCRHAYRKRGDVSVHCAAIEGNMDYCGHQYHCPNTQQWEVNCAASCSLKSKPPVKEKEKPTSLR